MKNQFQNLIYKKLKQFEAFQNKYKAKCIKIFVETKNIY